MVHCTPLDTKGENMPGPNHNKSRRERAASIDEAAGAIEQAIHHITEIEMAIPKISQNEQIRDQWATIAGQLAEIQVTMENLAV
jgi:hypothetical protein